MRVILQLSKNLKNDKFSKLENILEEPKENVLDFDKVCI